MRILYTIIFLLASVVASAQTDTSDWQNVSITTCLENGQVHGYMTNVNYGGIVSRTYDSRYYSRISTYANPVTAYRKDQPAPVIVPLPAAVPEDCLLTYCDSADTSRTDTVRISAGADNVKIWNLTPSRTYYYKVGEVTRGTIHTTGQLLQYKIDSGFNVRDIGGYATKDGNRLRYGQIFRGSELKAGRHQDVTDEDIAELLRLGAAAELDLRNTKNFLGGVFQEASALGEDVPYKLVEMKDTIAMLSYHPEEIREVFEFIYENLSNDRPVYFHCTYGADRTGTLCALLELLCGVNMGDIYKDYELSSMANDVVASDLMRYYYVINQRIVRPLNILTAAEAPSKVREYLQYEVGLSATLLDKLVDCLVEKDDELVTGIRNANVEPSSVGQKRAEGTYNLFGIRTKDTSKGVKLMRRADGKVVKVM